MKLSKKEYKYRCKTIAENHFNKEEQKMLDELITLNKTSYKEDYFKESSSIRAQIKFRRLSQTMASIGESLDKLSNTFKNFYQALEKSPI
jgi:hypothetical protein